MLKIYIFFLSIRSMAIVSANCYQANFKDVIASAIK